MRTAEGLGSEKAADPPAVSVGPDAAYAPAGHRNQFWSPYPGQDILLCLGIHGQMSYINRPAQLVAVKLSSWPLPQDAWKFFATIRAFDAIAAWAGLPPIPESLSVNALFLHFPAPRPGLQ